MAQEKQELLYFWVIGDMHFRAREQWEAIHAPRMRTMFEDMHTVWDSTGFPAFCVSPGDIVDTGYAANYALAKREIAAELGRVAFYPGIGNHEYQPEKLQETGKEDDLHTAQEFEAEWGRPVRSSWTAGPANEIVCIMLDQPNPFLPGMREEDKHVNFSQESLTFLDAALSNNAHRRAIIFAHCPLHHTVLDRDPSQNLDDDSLDPFFFVENSSEVRAILAKHRNAALYISGHTHSSWGSPQLVFTEMLGEHPVTHINVMSPWYTGTGAGPRLNQERTRLEYRPASPDVLATFAFHVYHDRVVVRVREHNTKRWLAEWEILLET
ncbi:MAG: hypothetical protein NVS4B11_33620 [Ktedonobacteraceae bacterium]